MRRYEERRQWKQQGSRHAFKIDLATRNMRNLSASSSAPPHGGSGRGGTRAKHSEGGRSGSC